MKRASSLVAIVAIAAAFSATAIAQSRSPRSAGWTPPRTPWGDPDLQGIYTNRDEANTPLERPDQFRGKRIEDFTPQELADLTRQRQAQAARIAGGIGGAETGAGPTHWYEHLAGKTTRPWLIVDPPDGTLPAMTPQAQKREAAVAALNNARDGDGRADSWLDRSMYDRCITRGLPGSMMPAIYGNSYEIVQAPGYVVIRYEMIHEARVIPLAPATPSGTGPSTPVAGQPHLASGIRQYLGDARGHWDGTTLVVETTNFTNRTHWGYNNRYNSEKLRLTERFTPLAPDALQWQATIDDPDVWVRPFTFAMSLTRDDTQGIFEYACHEGNRGLEHILQAARAEERARR